MIIFNLYFINILDYFTSIVSLLPNIDQNQFMFILNSHVDAAKVKDETFSHLKACAK